MPRVDHPGQPARLLQTTAMGAPNLFDPTALTMAAPGPVKRGSGPSAAPWSPNCREPLSRLQACLLQLLELDPRLAHADQRPRMRLALRLLDPRFNTVDVGRALMRLREWHDHDRLTTHAFGPCPEVDPDPDDAARTVDELLRRCEWPAEGEHVRLLRRKLMVLLGHSDGARERLTA